MWREEIEKERAGRVEGERNREVINGSVLDKKKG